MSESDGQEIGVSPGYEDRVSKDDDGYYDCRKKYANFYFENEQGDRGNFRCGSWDCYCCSHRMRYNIIREVRRLAKERGLTRFLTLTLSPKNIPSWWSLKRRIEYIMEMWNKFRIYLNRKYGQTSFVWVLELQERGSPHLHILVSRYVPQGWISRTWAGIGAGEIVFIEQVDVHRVGNYLSKYLAGGSLMELPKGVNRYGYSSGSIEFEVRKKRSGDGEKWTLKVQTPTVFSYSGEASIVRSVKRIDFLEPPPTLKEFKEVKD